MYELQTWIEISLLDLNLSGIDFYLYRLPQDQLDSALSKTSVAATEYFLIAYDADTQTLTQLPEQANLNNIDPNQGQPESQCGYDRPWLSCIRSINIARQELSLLIVPSENRAVPRAQSVGVLLIGLLSTSFFVMYVLLAKRNTMKIKAQNMALKQLLEKLQQTQTQLVQREKMSSLGELVAGIAHEFNNPLGFITVNLEYISKYSDSLINLLNLYLTHYPEPHPEIQKNIEAIELDFILKDISKILTSMEIGGERLRQIVLSLRNFSRLDEAALKAVDIHEGIDNTIMILSHRLKASHNHAEFKIVKKYGDLPLIQCYPGQINQVFMNILANAIDVLEEKSEKLSPENSGQDIQSFEEESIFCPQIEVSTLMIDENWISIQISDNGMGIPEDIQDRLFNPFFTTKPVGKGTGLGLSISYKIVDETHGGRLSFQSEPMQGTQFMIKLPISKKVLHD
ncbi:MAG: HAMP domain-containing histidine kinase [Cyanothece sp. SIO2G6]|nr:HAMP domain-containing histidine kinase [Cyanothece sp. SIO2G6]